MNLTETIAEARRVSVPLVYITTSDVPACTRKILPSLKAPSISEDDDSEEAIITWNIADGLNPLTGWDGEDRSIAVLARIIADEKVTQQQTSDINTALKAIKSAPDSTIFVFQILAPSAFFQGPRTLQQIFNLRDVFKSRSCMLVMMGPDVGALPPGIAGDVVMLVDPQPNLEELKGIVSKQHRDLKTLYPQIRDLSEEETEHSAMTVLGLGAFGAETSVSMCLREDGIDTESLREQRYDRLDQIKGVTVWRGSERFADIGGCEGIKEDLRLVLNSSKKKIGAIFYLDELDKMLSGVGGGDLSGMADEYLGLLLSYMQDHEVSGMLFLGPPGTSKTMISKALGNESQRITISVNMSLMKDHLMGNSEANLNQFFRIATAISGDKSLFLASCLTGQTVIARSDGALVPISIENTDNPPWSVSLTTGKTIQRHQKNAIKTTVPKTILIQTSTSEIQCTPEHKFYRFSREGLGEVTAEQLNPGDFLASPRILPHGRETMSPDLAYIVGYTTGDGNRWEDRLQWAEKNHEHAMYFAELCKVLGRQARFHRRKQNNSTLVYLHNREIVENFHHKFPEAVVVGQYKRACPISISQGDATVVRNFLSGLFDAEGNVTKHVIQMATTSPILAHQVVMLLKRFGIIATLYREKKSHRPKYHDAYKINICGQQAVAFTQEIGFRIADKQQLALEVSAGKRVTYNADCIPIDWEEMKKLYPRRIGEFFTEGRFTTVHRWKMEEAVRRIEKENLDATVLRQWLSFSWTKIKSVHEIEEDTEVFDLILDSPHTYIANNIVTHNCNSAAKLPTSLLRRFKTGRYFFDLPTREERAVIWNIKMAKYQLEPQDLPPDNQWTGAEIEACCERAWLRDIPLIEAGKAIIPVAVAAPEELQQLRISANNRFLNAATGLPYAYTGEAEQTPKASVGRRMRLQ